MYDSLAERFGRDMVALINNDGPESIGKLMQVLHPGQGLDQGNCNRFPDAELMVADLSDLTLRDLQEILYPLYPLIE